MARRCAWLCLLAVCALGGGCAPLEPAAKPTENPFLKPLTLGNDGIVLEVFFARLSQDDAAQDSALWTDIDEQSVPTDLRRQWEANGLRVGYVGGQLPQKLAQLLESGRAASSVKRPSTDDPRPAVTRNLMQMQSGNLNEIVASGQIARLALVFNDDGQLRGKTYENAEAKFALKAYSKNDGRVRLELTPELEYGEGKARYVGEDGIFRLDASRPKQVFDKLLLQTPLGPGQLLVLGHAIDKSGSLGYHFFTEDNNGHRESKLILIRLGQPQQDDLFSQPDKKPAPESKP
ncbi:MAG TPA: hypothetical protein VFE24_15010 [Pirellulales bacterium]|nr:hypothetical protein [Pirellulales bacterium]